MIAGADSLPGSHRGNGRGGPPAPTKENPAPGSGPLGMGLFLLSLGVLFLGSLVAYAVIRYRAEAWPPPDVPPLPRALWVSTVLILAGSVTIQWSLANAKSNRRTALRVTLAATLALALSFLASQSAAWIQLVSAAATIRASLYGWLFYFLTGLHAVHVLGGIAPLIVVTVNAHYGRVTPLSLGGLRYCVMYWHFLGGVWLVLFTMLVATT